MVAGPAVAVAAAAGELPTDAPGAADAALLQAASTTMTSDLRAIQGAAKGRKVITAG